jgi:hypothetical protein
MLDIRYQIPPTSPIFYEVTKFGKGYDARIVHRHSVTKCVPAKWVRFS